MLSKTLSALVLCTAISQTLLAAGVCFHCEEIREYNRQHPQKYDYYEDYLEEQDKKNDDKEKSEAKDVQDTQHS